MTDGYNKAKDTGFTQTLFGSDEPKETSPKEYEFKACELEYVRKFMEQYHYSRSAEVAAKYCFALVSKRVGIVGVAIYSKPAMNSIYKLYAEKEEDVVELRRLVCIDDTPKNTESYFVGKTLRWLVLNTQHKAMVTYADPSFGHVGHAYRACNMKYDGMSGTTVVLELPVSECVHGGACLGENKPFCQVHDRNMRCKTKDGLDYTPEAKKLRILHEKGIAKLVPRQAKHRYHYHLEEQRSGKPQDCRQCRENQSKMKAVALSTPKIKPIEIPKETSTTFIPDGYIIDDKPSTIKIAEKVTKDNIEQRMEKAWTKDTSYWQDKWTPENPAYGQCAVTALIVQEHLGGDLMRCEVEGFGSHYFNRLSDGTVVDLTKKQFPKDAKMTPAKAKKREDITQYKAVVKRYETLKQRFEVS